MDRQGNSTLPPQIFRPLTLEEVVVRIKDLTVLTNQDALAKGVAPQLALARKLFGPHVHLLTEDMARQCSGKQLLYLTGVWETVGKGKFWDEDEGDDEDEGEYSVGISRETLRSFIGLSMVAEDEKPTSPQFGKLPYDTWQLWEWELFDEEEGYQLKNVVPDPALQWSRPLVADPNGVMLYRGGYGAYHYVFVEKVVQAGAV